MLLVSWWYGTQSLTVAIYQPHLQKTHHKLSLAELFFKNIFGIWDGGGGVPNIHEYLEITFAFVCMNILFLFSVLLFLINF